MITIEKKDNTIVISDGEKIHKAPLTKGLEEGEQLLVSLASFLDYEPLEVLNLSISEEELYKLNATEVPKVNFSDMFVFEYPDLFIHGRENECLIGTLSETLPLINKRKEQFAPEWKDKNISDFRFFPIYNVKTGTIELNVNFWHCYYDSNEQYVEKECNAPLKLTSEESFALMNIMNNHCHQHYGKNCFELVNDYRLSSNRPLIEVSMDESEMFSTIKEQAYLMFEDGDISSSELTYVDACIFPITNKYLNDCAIWEDVNHKFIPLSVEFEIMHNAISDALSTMQVKNSENEKKPSLTDQIQVAAGKAPKSLHNDISKGVER